MTTVTKATLAWDAAEYLKTEIDVAEYLAAAFETGDAGDVTRALATIARSRGMSEIAKTAGLARGSLYKAIGEGANPTLSTLLSLMDALNVTLSVKPKAVA
jgi:probable addiction module antidote protein